MRYRKRTLRGRTLRVAVIAAALLLVAGGAIALKLRMDQAAPEAPEPVPGVASVEEARMRQQLDAALEEVRRGIEADPNNPDGYFRLSQVYAAAGDLDYAISSLLRCLELDPKYIEAHLALGEMYKGVGYFDKSLEHFQTALDINGKHIGALVSMARLFFQFADGYAPLPYLLKAEQLAPQSAEIQMDLTMAYFLQNENVKAQAHIERAAQLEPNNTLVLQRLGVLYSSTNQYAKARELLARVTAMDIPPEQQIEARKSLAKVELRDPKGSVPAARDWLQQLTRGGYTDAEVEFLQGEVSRRLERSQEAIAHYEAAMQGEAPYPDALKPLADLYRSAGRTADAERLAGQVASGESSTAALRELSARLARNPKQPEAWLQLADRLHALGLDNYAIFYLRRGLLFNPGNADLRRALAGRYVDAGRGADAERERAAIQ